MTLELRVGRDGRGRGVGSAQSIPSSLHGCQAVALHGVNELGACCTIVFVQRITLSLNQRIGRNHRVGVIAQSLD